MPRGQKICPSCGEANGNRAKACKNCQAVFQKIKNEEEQKENSEQSSDTKSPDKKKRGRKPGSKNKPPAAVVKQRILAPQGRRFPKVKYTVIHLQKTDSSWFFDLFNRYRDRLNSDPKKVWDDYVNNVDHKYVIIGIRPYGFCRFHYLEDGTKAICELAVYAEHQKKGIGRKLVEDIGSPMVVACYKEVEDFYRKCGFTWFGNATDDKGNQLEVYKK